MYRKLTDAQVITLMFILANNPPVPMDMDRYPTVRMFLDNNIVERKNGHLQLVLTAPEFAYQHVVPSFFYAKVYDDHRTFESLEKAGLIKFNPDANPDQTDKFLFYDALVLKDSLEKLGAECSSGFEDGIALPKCPTKETKARELLREYIRKYPNVFEQHHNI